jgi:acetolactate synthase I/III small subunit
MEKDFTISVYSENKIGLLNRITIIFTRRKINIESINASESEVEGVYRYTIVITASKEMAVKITKQIEKQVEVLKAFLHEEDQTVYQEIALYKMATDILTDSNVVERLIRNNNARILTVEKDFMVIEKTGHYHETQELFYQLEAFGVLEFVRSGRVAITKPMKPLTSYLKELEEANSKMLNYQYVNQTI